MKPRKLAHSDRLALPRMTAPARRSDATTAASAGTLLPTRARDPAVVSMRSAVAMLSLTMTGIREADRGAARARRSASRCAAMPKACGLVSMTAPSNGSIRPIRRRYAFVSAEAGQLARRHQATGARGIVASNHGVVVVGRWAVRASGPAPASPKPLRASTRRPVAPVAPRKCRRLSRSSRMPDMLVPPDVLSCDGRWGVRVNTLVRRSATLRARSYYDSVRGGTAGRLFVGRIRVRRHGPVASEKPRRNLDPWRSMSS